MRYYLTLALFGLFVAGSYAQFGVGGHFNYMMYGQGSSYKPFGLGVNLAYGASEKNVIRFSYIYSFPLQESYYVTANALSSTTDPTSISVRETSDLGAMHFCLDLQRYFGNQGFGRGFYLALGVGLTTVTLDIAQSGYDKTLYSAGQTGTFSEGKWVARILPGYELGFPFGNLFIEAGLHGSGNSQELASVPMAICATTGYRYLFGEPSVGAGKKTGKGSGGGKMSTKNKRKKSSASRKKAKKKKR